MIYRSSGPLPMGRLSVWQQWVELDHPLGKSYRWVNFIAENLYAGSSRVGTSMTQLLGSKYDIVLSKAKFDMIWNLSNHP